MPTCFTLEVREAISHRLRLHAHTHNAMGYLSLFEVSGDGTDVGECRSKNNDSFALDIPSQYIEHRALTCGLGGIH